MKEDEAGEGGGDGGWGGGRGRGVAKKEEWGDVKRLRSWRSEVGEDQS